MVITILSPRVINNVHLRVFPSGAITLSAALTGNVNDKVYVLNITADY